MTLSFVFEKTHSVLVPKMKIDSLSKYKVSNNRDDLNIWGGGFMSIMISRASFSGGESDSNAKINNFHHRMTDSFLGFFQQDKKTKLVWQFFEAKNEINGRSE